MKRFPTVKTTAMLCSALLCACTAPQEASSRMFEQPAFASARNSQIAWLADCEGSTDWDRAGPPFRIYGNSFHVGTCGIAVILIAGDEGHIVIDSGTLAGSEVVAANIQALGFDLAEVHTLLHTQEHFDHVGGLASLQEASGARLLTSDKAAQVFRSGIAHPDDPQAGLHDPFPAARVDGIVQDKEVVNLGRLALLPLATPGHSAGALSWQWIECEGGQCLTILFSDGLGPISSDDYRFTDHPDYLRAFKASMDKIRHARCDIFLTPHPTASAIPERIRSEAGLIDDRERGLYGADLEALLNKRIARETAGED
jgi:metallo-beta-lactamase class B